MFVPAASASINHLLRSNNWALEQLRPFAGKTAQFECSPLQLALVVMENGEVASPPYPATPEVTITLSPGLLLRVLARDETAWTEIRINGNTDFASAINHVWRNLRWDAEEDLSRVFGDIAAHRMAKTGRSIEQWGRQSADNLMHSLAEYWTEEQPLIAGKYEVEQFNRDVDALRDDLARIEKRLEHLALST
jgi:ubiquinone biosynthesis protein UbiJ